MANNRFPVASYNFTSDDKLFFDANIWFYIYGPQEPNNSKTVIYSRALANILAAKSRIYIDVLVVSEFINTYARVKWKVMGNPHGNFKQFRKSRDFKPIARDIAADIRRVMHHCKCVENGFDTLDINGLMTDYAAGNSDFNDQVIARLCQSKGLKLVTNDGDFRDCDITVVTANQRLLR